ncbi:DsbA family oxidoreductase [Paenibacillus doosanensis]|uniref:DsbA family oxidoreductase n=1 Tax=Paenibacillus doosanensis TaxID=1229154 RepID=UPI00217FA4BD|nr:DsbA family oxidoreductase [Paenibacillus doosanensis]MCS7459658.1 DsbA family oxidoreductase [Paenibacillus doosanensis]
MTLRIQAYSDFICPFCFLAKTPLDEAVQGKDVEIEWMPFELRPSPAPKIDPWEDPSKLRGWESYITPMAEQWGVRMKLPHISPHPYTGLAFEGYHYAKDQGRGNAYMSRVFAAFFQEEQDIGQLDVLTKLAAEIGLEEAGFREALQSGKYRDIQAQALRHAYEEAGITAVPTFIIGSERVQGAVSREALESVIMQQLEREAGGKTQGLQCDASGDCAP